MKSERGDVIVQIHFSQKYSPMTDLKPAWRRRFGAFWRSARLAGWLFAMAAGTAVAADAPHLQTDSSTSTAGYYRLTWDGDDDGTQYQLQESRQRDFSTPQTLYEGPDRASLLSGRHDGEYFYRVRTVPAQGQPGPWSDVVAVEVAHHSLGRAFLFFGLGAVVFIATLVMIVGGTLKSKKQENG